MNTIKIYLAESGALAQLQKDFPLYQYQFNNKLLNIFVPTSICAGNFIDENISEGYACQVKMDYMDSQNKQHRTGAFYCRYVKTLTQNGVEYALFERTLPYAFTLYAGQGVGAPTLTITIVNVAEHDGTPAVISTISSQECALDVLDSTPVADIDEPIDPDIVTELEAKMTTIISQLALKQNIALDQATIQAIEAIITSGTAPTSVEPSLISLFQRTQTNASKDISQDGRMDNMQAQIDAIAQAQVVGIRVIGTMSATNTLPTNAELDQFRLDKGYTDATNGDIIYINLTITGGTDKFYIATYNTETELWTETEAQFLENASNSDKGIVKGTALDQSDHTKILFDVQNGVIVDALAYRNNAWVSIRDYFNTINGIMDGTIAVPKATGDAQGNNIQITYQTKTEGASKEYVQEYAMPKIVNDVYYMDFTNEELVGEIVNNATLTCNINAVGDNLLKEFVLTLDQDLEIGAKNGMLASAWIEPAIQMTGKVHTILKYAKAEEEYATWYNLGADFSEVKQMIANTEYKFEVNTYFDQLADVITLGKDDKIKLEVYFYTENLYNSTMDLIANETDKGIAFIDRLSYVQYVVESNDYNALDNKPIINENLTNVSVGDLSTNTLYRHIGATDSTYTMGMIYFKQTAQDVALTPLWKEWVEGASLGGTALSVVNNIIQIPAITPDLVPFVDLADMVDNTPTENSDNLITSGGVASALKGKADITDIAPAYDPTSTYAVGDIVSYDGDIYKCNTAISVAEAWDSTHWTRKSVQELIEENVPDLSGYVATTGAQTIAGTKTFTGNVKFNSIINSDNSSIRFYVPIRPNTSGATDLGEQYGKWNNLYLAGQLKDGNNVIYGLVLPNTASYTANKTIATTDDINTAIQTAITTALNTPV